MTPLDLILDTETSGLPRKGVPLDDPSQPHLLELACHLVDDTFTPVASFDCIIRPDGWAIEPEASRVHGITEAHAYQVGIPLTAALVVLQAFTEKARRIVAHNMEFERTIISSELARLRAAGKWWWGRSQAMRCTKEEATPFTKIPGEYGDYRWPSLEEAHAFFYPGWQVDHGGARDWKSDHRASGDLDACTRVWKALQKETAT